MKIAELRQKSVVDLKEELHELLQEQFKLRMRQGVDQSARPHEFGKVRRAIAQVNTLIKEKAKES